MRKLIFIACGFMCLAGGTYFLNAVVGQDKPARNKEAAAEDVPHKIALIDMEYVFKNYEKLKYLQEEMKADLQVEDNKLKDKAKKGQQMVAELKDYKPDTPEYDARRQKIEKLDTDMKFDQKQIQARLQRENAKITLTVYHEMHDAVEKFCKHFNYTLAIQFTRTEANSSDPQRMMQVMNQQVVYYRKADSGKCKDDLSEPVVKWLNEKYAKDSGGDTAETPVASAQEGEDLIKRPEGPESGDKQSDGTAPAGPKRVKTAD